VTGTVAANGAVSHPAIFTEHYGFWDNGLKKDEIDTRYDSNGTADYVTTVNWAYDNEGKLLSESSSVTTGGPAALNYTDSFTYDLDNNRTKETITGSSDSGNNGTIAYTYNGDDQLRTETGTYANSAED